jgi:PTH1 family peptidyl-tRNA hydrolase
MVVGLGNPGPEYRGTRHNVGFELIDLIAEKHHIRLDKARHQARFGIGRVSDSVVLLVKPLTFMNLSGRAVAPLAKEYNLDPAHILVVADDKDLALGRTRIKPKGSAGGHNGHKSVIASLGTEEYPRLKIGIDAPNRKGGLIDHVLGGFNAEERASIQAALQKAMLGVETLANRGLEAGMNVVNESDRP